MTTTSSPEPRSCHPADRAKQLAEPVLNKLPRVRQTQFLSRVVLGNALSSRESAYSLRRGASLSTS